MSLLLFIEILATTTSLGYLLLLIRQNSWCWSLSIISGLLSMYLFFESRLYAETALYGYFVIISIYGWWAWTAPKRTLRITKWSPAAHFITILSGILLSGSLGYLMNLYTDADKPYFDAFTSIFSLIASFMEARKVLSGWIYWTVINSATVWLYHSKSLDIYALLMVVYFIMSILGYLKWRREYYTS